MTDVTVTATSAGPYRVGAWLPSDHAVLSGWMSELAKAAHEAESAQKPLLPVIEDFKQLIENDPRIYMLFNQMFAQVPSKPPYNENPAGHCQVRHYQHMLRMLNIIMTRAPTFNESGMVGFPINAIFDWSMGTEAGFAAFVHPEVNAMLKEVLNAWGAFLTTADSSYVLTERLAEHQGSAEFPDCGWFAAPALRAMVAMLPAVPGSGEPPYWDRTYLSDAEVKQVFVDTFRCDPTEEHWGYDCWDDFFTRAFREGQRPVPTPAPGQTIVLNACESAPFNIEMDVKRRAPFWVKGQPYSLEDMLDHDPAVDEFVGGTVYQAFLAAKSYHCWHSPVSGTVRTVKVIDGTYYSEIPSQGFYNPLYTDDAEHGHDAQTPDDAGPNNSQGYISEVATRGLILIDADDPALGLVGMVPIGMAEVSSIDFTVGAGDHVEAGQPIGKFHFGGSSHCLLFRKGVELVFDLCGQQPNLNATNLAVRSLLATVVK